MLICIKIYRCNLQLIYSDKYTIAKIFTPFTVASMLFIDFKLHDKLIQSIKTIINRVVILAITLCISGLRPLKWKCQLTGV